MGCGSSRSAPVKQIDPNKPPPVPKPRSAGDRGASAKGKSKSADLLSRAKKKGRPDSTTSAVTVAAIGLRGNSASSNKSVDSGIGSDSRKSPDRRTNSATTTKNAPMRSPLSIDTEPPPRADETKILNSLRQEGFLGAKETSTSKGGVCFEIGNEELKDGKHSKPPVRLATIERKAQLEMTKLQIKQKLERAERRRKKREHEKIERSRDKDARNLEVKLALLEIEKSKEKEIQRQTDRKISDHVVRKNAQLEQIVDKQKQEQLKIEEVRNRKLLSPRPAFPDPEELAMMQPRPSPRNIDDLPVAAARLKIK